MVTKSSRRGCSITILYIFIHIILKISYIVYTYMDIETHQRNQAFIEIHPMIQESKKTYLESFRNQVKASAQELYKIDFDPSKNSQQILEEILEKIKSEVSSTFGHKYAERGKMDFGNDRTTHHYCYNISADQKGKYYYCMECSEMLWAAKDVLICEGCFKKEDHQGHRFFQKSYPAGQVYCHCNVNGKVNELYRCRRHYRNQEIGIKKLSDQRKSFINIYSNCLKLCTNLPKTTSAKILNQLCETLLIWCQNSAIQCKMALQILKVAYKSSSYTSYLLAYVVSQAKQANQLLLKICAHKDLHFQLLVFIVYKFIPTSTLKVNLKTTKIMDEVIFSFEVLESLVQRRIFYGPLLKHYERFSLMKQYYPKGIKMLENYIKLSFQIMNTNPQSYFLESLVSNPIFQSPQMAALCFKYCLDNYSKAKQNADDSADWQSQNNLQLRLLTEIIFQFIIKISQGVQQKIVGIKEYLKAKKLYNNSFDDFLGVLVHNIGHYFQKNDFVLWNEQSFIILTVLIMVRNSKRKDNLMYDFWHSVLDGRELRDAVKNIYTVICIVLWKKELLELFKRSIRSKNPSSESIVENSNMIKNFVSRWFQCSQYLQKQRVVQLKGQVLSAEEFESIFQTNSLDNVIEPFFFWAPKFKLPDKFRDQFWCWTENQFDIKKAFSQSNSIWYGFERVLYERKRLSPNDLMILNDILKHQVIMTKLMGSFQTGIISGEEYYLYIFTLVVINGFKTKKDDRITEFLDKIRKEFQQAQQVFAFYEAHSFQFSNRLSFEQLEKLKKLFLKPEKLISYFDICLHGKQYSAKQIQQLKIKFVAHEQILNKIYQYCTNQNQYRLLSNLLVHKQPQEQNKIRLSNYTRKLQKKRQYEQKQQQKRQKRQKNQIQKKPLFEKKERMCLICYSDINVQKGEFVYLGRIKIKKSVGKTYHQEKNDIHLSVRTCFHAVHLSCFSRKLKKCPQCNKAVNCYFLCDYKKGIQQSRQSMQTFFKLNFQNFGLDNFFMLLFLGIVSSSSIKFLQNKIRLKIFCLQQSQDYVQRVTAHQIYTNQIDEFLLELIIDTYDMASEQEKKEYLKSVEKYVKSFSSNKSKGIYQEVKRIFSQILKEKIFEIAPDLKLIEQLQKLRQTTKEWEVGLVNDRVQLTEGDIEKILANSQNKNIFKLQLRQPPSTSTQFQQKMKYKLCELHGKDNYFYCLTECKYFCSLCQLDRFQRQTTAFIEIQTLNLTLKHKNTLISQQIYQNDLSIHYSQGRKYNVKHEVFRLDRKKFKDLVDEFVN